MFSSKQIPAELQAGIFGEKNEKCIIILQISRKKKAHSLERFFMLWFLETLRVTGMNREILLNENPLRFLWWKTLQIQDYGLLFKVCFFLFRFFPSRNLLFSLLSIFSLFHANRPLKNPDWKFLEWMRMWIQISLPVDT